MESSKQTRSFPQRDQLSNHSRASLTAFLGLLRLAKRNASACSLSSSASRASEQIAFSSSVLALSQGKLGMGVSCPQAKRGVSIMVASARQVPDLLTLFTPCAESRNPPSSAAIRIPRHAVDVGDLAIVHPWPHGASITYFAGARDGFDHAGIGVNLDAAVTEPIGVLGPRGGGQHAAAGHCAPLALLGDGGRCQRCGGEQDDGQFCDGHVHFPTKPPNQTEKMAPGIPR